jgi:mono/diheme cytochrome c family protein
MPAPSFRGQVQAIYQAKCQACHAPGGQEAVKPYTTLGQIRAEPLSTMLGQVYNCVMPLAGAPPLTPDERQALLGWLVCMEPDN